MKELNMSESEGNVVRRKRGMYNHYDDKVKAKVAKYENGNKAAVVKSLGTLFVKESSVRSLKHGYLEKHRCYSVT